MYSWKKPLKHAFAKIKNLSWKLCLQILYVTATEISIPAGGEKANISMTHKE